MVLWFSLQMSIFEQRLYSTTTDPQGRFSLKLPPVLMNTSIIPPSSSSAIQTFKQTCVVTSNPLNGHCKLDNHFRGSSVFEGSAVPFSMIEVFQGDEKWPQDSPVKIELDANPS